MRKTQPKNAGRRRSREAGDAPYAADRLNRVSLKRLTITPERVLPFEEATIHWSVGGADGVDLRLNGSRVGPTGSLRVIPTDSRTYRLIAFADGKSRDLGSAALALSSQHCVRAASSLIDELWSGALIDAIKEPLYFRLVPSTISPFGNVKYVQSKPVVRIENGRISFRLLLESNVGYFPNPSVDIVGSFGMAVVPVTNFDSSVIVAHTKIVAANVEVSVEVSFPWYAYLVPGAAIGLPIRASMEEDSGRRAMTDGIHEFVDKIMNWPSPKPGLIKHAVDIYVDEYGDGLVEVEFCPVQQLSIDSGSD